MAIAEWLASRRGVQRYATAFVLGALAAAALAPLHLVPVLLISFPGWAWLVAASTRARAALAAGWWFGFGFFVAGLYWVGHAFLVDAERFAALAPLAVLGLPAGLALFPAIAGWAIWRTRLGGLGLVFGLALAWTAAEWLRGFLLTGFPWNLVGYTWTAFDGMTQLAALAGIHGLSFLTVVLAALPVLLMDRGRTPPARWRPLLAGLVVLLAVWGGGHLRLAGAADETVPGVQLRLVQPNVAQADKWRPDLREAHFARLLRMSSAPGHDRITHIIWPEAAIPYFVSREPARARMIGALVAPDGLVLAGARRLSPEGVDPIRVWNSVLAIDHRGRIVEAYDKAHLVPFGEYVPLRGLLRWLGVEKVTPGPLDFSAGPGPRTLVLDGLPAVAPLICYEVIFAAVSRAPGPRASWLLNLTNDAWFGVSSGPYQHLAMARVRAVEEGVPLVRVANTGISAIVDPHGRTLARLGLGRAGVLDGALPQALVRPPLYGRIGDLVLVPAAVVLVIGLWLHRRRFPRAAP